MRKWLNSYFNISKREYNGLIMMVLLIAVVTVIPDMYEFLVPEQENLRAEYAAIEKLSLVEAEKKRVGMYRKPSHEKITLFNFDPNQLDVSGWQRLGLSARQAAVMERYQAKGGRFRKKEDLQKMYPISAALYKQLIPYIHITPVPAVEHSFSTVVKRQPVIVALNSADTLALDEVKGIGPTFARRIVKYRDRLGGFYKKEQLLEVFGLDSLKYREIKDQVSIDEHSIKMIYINRVEYADLQHHPYLNFKLVNAILQYRKQHGNYGNIADLKKIAILPAQIADKLAPYISFDHD